MQVTIASIKTTVINHLSSISSREMAQQQTLYNKYPRTNNTTKQTMKFDLGPMLERPIPYKNINWSTTNTRFAILENTLLPHNFLDSFPSVKSLVKNFAFYRTRAKFYITLTGTINHQGTLLAGIIPANYEFSTVNSTAYINTLLTAPHCLIGANEASASCIEIPFYINSDFAQLSVASGGDVSTPDITISNSSYARLVVMVLNPLAVTGASSTTLTLHTEIQFEDFEVYVQSPTNPTFVSPPTLLAESFIGPVITSTLDASANLVKKTSADFIDALRKTVKSYTGLHNPNECDYKESMLASNRNRANQVDSPTYYEKLDPYSKFSRLTRDSIFHTDIDEMDMSFILSKPQYIGTLQVLTTTAQNRLLWSRPISPWQGGCYGGTATTNNIERLYYNTLAWSGDMELIIQSSMTNKQNVKLLVCRMYGLDRRILTAVPDANTCRSGISTLLEFSGGNQQLTVDLDYLSRNQVLYNTIDFSANALMHGMYYILLQQPLVSGEGSPVSVEFNLFIRCKPNFRFYGHGYRPSYTSSVHSKGPYYANPVTSRSIKTLEVLEESQKEEDEVKKEEIFESESATGESAFVMNAPSVDQPLLKEDVKETSESDEILRLRPILHLRDLVRKVQSTNVYSATSDTNGQFVLAIPVVDLINHFPTGPSAQSSGSSLMKMFYGLNAGLRIKIKGRNCANYLVQYYPPNIVSGSSAGVATTDFLVGSVVSALNSDYLVNNKVLNSAPFVEMPHSWGVDIFAGCSYSVTDVHIPHTTMYHWWGAADWSKTSNFSFDTYKTLVNNMGTLIITGTGVPNTIFDFNVYAGLDDEARLGFLCFSPILWLPLTNDGLYYDVPEKVPTTTAVDFTRVAPTAPYYTSLVTAFDTSPIV